MLDNYDSFTYNLVHYIEKISGTDVNVYRNDEISIDEIQQYDKICLSPGPGLPAEAGIMSELIKGYYQEKSILGICLGMQAIAEVFGGRLKNLSEVQHGVARKTDVIKDDPFFENIPASFLCGRYHSWVVAEVDFPSDLEITAIDGDKNVMALRHKKYDLRGVQFHPESVLTEYGEQLIANWLKI